MLGNFDIFFFLLDMAKDRPIFPHIFCQQIDRKIKQIPSTYIKPFGSDRRSKLQETWTTRKLGKQDLGWKYQLGKTLS